MKRLLISIFIVSALELSNGPAAAQSDYDKVLCVSNGKREAKCSVTVTKRSIVFKYASGRTEIVKRSRIKEVLSRDESVRRGFVFTHVDRRYVYGIDFTNIDGDDENVSVAFDDYELSKEFDNLLSSD